MKRIYLFTCIGFGVALNAGAETFGGIEFPAGSQSFADEYISYTQGSDNVSGDYNNPLKALGIPDFSDAQDTGYVSLGDTGEIVLKFTDNSLTTSGDSELDLWIFEIGGSIEPTDVHISTDGNTWVYVGSTEGGTRGIDIDAFTQNGVVLGEKYSYVKLIDLLPSQSSSPWEGADIDAVGAISSAEAVPSVCPIGTVSPNLDIHIPSINYESQIGTLNIWTNLEYLGINSDGKHIWGLKDFGKN